MRLIYIHIIHCVYIYIVCVTICIYDVYLLYIIWPWNIPQLAQFQYFIAFCCYNGQVHHPSDVGQAVTAPPPSWTPNFLSSPFNDIWAYQKFPQTNNTKSEIFQIGLFYGLFKGFFDGKESTRPWIANDLVDSWGANSNTSRSAMTSQCIILLWKDFIRSDLKRNGQRGCYKTPPPFWLVSNAFWVKTCYASYAYTARHLQNYFRDFAHDAFTMGHQRPPETPTLHRAAYWHLNARPIMADKTPRTSDSLKV